MTEKIHNIKRLVLLAFAVVLFLFIVFIFLSDCKYFVYDKLNLIFPNNFTYNIYYENCIPKYNINDVDFENCDVREVQVGYGRKKLVNHSRGFSLDFPRDAEFDFTTAQEYISIECENTSAVLTKEYSTYEEPSKTKEYVNNSINKYLLNDKFQKENKITLHKNDEEQIGNYNVQIIALSREASSKSDVLYNTYVYCYIYTDTSMFYRIMYKTDKFSDEFMEGVYKTLMSFSEDVEIVGISGIFTDYKPVAYHNWNDETKELYAELTNSDTCKWGIFTPWAVYDNNFDDIYALEEKIDEKFDAVLEYKYFFEDLPIEGMKRAYEEGKIIELTLQTSNTMNENLAGYSPVFDIIDGKEDERFRSIARQLRDFGHPVLFRLNNEMNSDWTSYGSAVTLTDPQIFVNVWHKIFNIFEEEGVDNAIWVFNPNDESYPPNGYNSSMAFYPGNEYVHIFGITGYNTGSYYDELNGEKWRSFDEIYSSIYGKYGEIYGEFPWIITEFASSSIGGDKVKWIEDMFEGLDKYQNIKMAFWFNSADYDTRPEYNGAVARPYWFDETPETTKAFSEGLKKHRAKNIN